MPCELNDPCCVFLGGNGSVGSNLDQVDLPQKGMVSDFCLRVLGVLMSRSQCQLGLRLTFELK